MKKLIIAIMCGIGFSCFTHGLLHASDETDALDRISFLYYIRNFKCNNKHELYEDVYGIGKTLPLEFFKKNFNTNETIDLKDRDKAFEKVFFNDFSYLSHKFKNCCLNYYAKNMSNIDSETFDKIKKRCFHEYEIFLYNDIETYFALMDGIRDTVSYNYDVLTYHEHILDKENYKFMHYEVDDGREFVDYIKYFFTLKRAEWKLKNFKKKDRFWVKNYSQSQQPTPFLNYTGEDRLRDVAYNAGKNFPVKDLSVGLFFDDDLEKYQENGLSTFKKSCFEYYTKETPLTFDVVKKRCFNEIKTFTSQKIYYKNFIKGVENPFFASYLKIFIKLKKNRSELKKLHHKEL